MAQPLELKPGSLQFTQFKSCEYNVTFDNIEFDTSELDTSDWNRMIKKFTILLDENVGIIHGEICNTGSKGKYPYFTLYNVREFEIDYALKAKTHDLNSEEQDIY